MNIAQTSQLIQLILNSVVMVVACVLLLNGLLRRQLALGDRLQQLRHQYLNGIRAAGVCTEPLEHLKHQIQQLQRQTQLAQQGVLAVHYALLFLLGSAFAIAFRTLIAADELIRIALVLFVLGTGVLLLSVGLTLCDLHSTDRWWQRLTNWQVDRKLYQPAKAAKPQPQKKAS